MIEKGPLVSIIIPTYNRSHLIEETIQSVFAQTYTNWELIIVDDGSTDDTQSKLDRYKRDGFRYIHISHSGSLGKVRNVGIKASRGQIIAFLDSDDLWQPDKLEVQISLLEDHPGCDFIFGHGVQFGTGAIPPPALEDLFIGNVFIPMLLEERFVFYVPTLMFRKAVLGSIGLINESMQSGGDIDFFFQMAYRFKGIFSNKIIARIRKHEQSTSQSRERAGFEEYIQMINGFFKKGALTRRQFSYLISRQYYKAGLLNLRQSNPGEASAHFWQCVKVTPFNFKAWVRLSQSFFLSLRFAI